MKFNEKLQKLRKENQMSQEQLADMLDVSRQAVSKWESGTTYPEMDKLLTMCKIFKCSLDDLTNDEISNITVTETKKKNISNWFNDFLEGINKAIKMFSRMRAKDFLKMCCYMIFVVFILLMLFIPVGLLIDLGKNIFEVFGGKIEIFLTELWKFILCILYFSLSVTIFIYIFKKRYLEPYDLAINDNEENSNISNDSAKIQEVKIKTVYKRDESEPLGFIGKFFVLISKILLFIILLPFLFTFIALFIAFIIMFLLLFKGVTYIGILMVIIFSILINYLIIEILLKLIFLIPLKFKKLFIVFIISIAGVGISTGLMIIEIAETKYYDKVPENIESKTFSEIIDFKNTMYIDDYQQYYYSYDINEINYVEDENYSDKIKIDFTYYEVFDVPAINLTFDDAIYIWNSETLSNWNILFNTIINNLKNKEFYNYNRLNEINVTVYASKKNIEIMNKNFLQAKERRNSYNCESENESIENLTNENFTLENKLLQAEEDYNILESKFDELKEEYTEYKKSISDFVKEN